MSEIYCKTGKLKVNLSPEAWDENRDAVPIFPCTGCRHSGHLKYQQNLEKERAKNPEKPVPEVNLHHVAVILRSRMGIPYAPEVFCSCDCRFTVSS